MRIFSFIFLFVFALSLSLTAQDAPSSPSSDTQPEKNSEIDIPVAIGQVVKGIRIPNFDESGELSMEFEAETAVKEKDTLIRMENLSILIIDAQDKEKTTVHMQSAVFDLDTKILTSESPTTLQRNDVEIVGDTAEFDTRSRFSRMKGNVKMTIFDIESFNH